MRVARLRRFAWMLVLVLSAGLVSPALASTSALAARALSFAAHTHGDGVVHAHGAPAVGRDAGIACCPPSEAPHHCPGCLTAAACAVACLGVGILPASVPVPSAAATKAWLPAWHAEPPGIKPPGDADPPRPVPVR